MTTLWKGIGSSLLVRGMSLAVEDVIGTYNTFPLNLVSFVLGSYKVHSMA